MAAVARCGTARPEPRATAAKRRSPKQIIGSHLSAVGFFFVGSHFNGVVFDPSPVQGPTGHTRP